MGNSNSAGKFMLFIALMLVAVFLILVVYGLCLEFVYGSAEVMMVSSEVVDSYGFLYVWTFMVLTTALVLGFVVIPVFCIFLKNMGKWFNDVAAPAAKKAWKIPLFSVPCYLVGLLLSNLNPNLLTISYGLFILTLVYPKWASKAVAYGQTGFNIYFPSVLLRLSQWTIPLELRKCVVGAVEITRIPASFLDSNKSNEVEEGSRFRQFLQGLCVKSDIFGFRLCFRDQARLLFLVKARDEVKLKERLLEIKAYFASHFPDFGTEICLYDEYPLIKGEQVAVRQVIGVPELVANPLHSLAEFFIKNRYAGDYVVIGKGVKPSRLNAFLLRRKYDRLVEEASQQKSKTPIYSDTQTTKTEADYFAQQELKETETLAKRFHSERLLKLWVYIVAPANSKEEAEYIVNGASSIFLGSMSSEDKLSALDTKRYHGRWAQILLNQLKPFGVATQLLPSEAVPYYWIPQMDTGIKVFRNACFKTPPQTTGELSLGNIVRNEETTEKDARLSLSSLKKHMFIAGVTGSGKTNTCLNLLIQLYEHDAPFLVIEPAKSEYRSLKDAIPDLRIFTIGNEGTAPFKLNPFEVPDGVEVQTHVDNLKAVFKASYVMYAPMPYVLEECLTNIYVKNGWSLLTNDRGRTPTLSDLYQEIETVSKQLGYEPKIIMDVEAALKTRIRNLMTGAKGVMLNTTHTLPDHELVSHPTVFELKSVADDEEKALLMGLILTRIHEHIVAQGETQKLRHVVVIEEAHHLLTNMATKAGDPEAADSRRKVVEQLANMLSEARAYGEGIIIVEQIPTKLVPDAIKNTGTKIAHRLLAADDRDVLGSAMCLGDEQKDAMTSLEVGEAIVSLDEYAMPFKVKAKDVATSYSVRIGRVSDEATRQHMRIYYQLHPTLKTAETHCPLCLDRCKHRDAARIIIGTRAFEESFKKTASAWEKNPKALAKLLLKHAYDYMGEKIPDSVGLAYCLLIQASHEYLSQNSEDLARLLTLYGRFFQKGVEIAQRNRQQV